MSDLVKPYSLNLGTTNRVCLEVTVQEDDFMDCINGEKNSWITKEKINRNGANKYDKGLGGSDVLLIGLLGEKALEIATDRLLKTNFEYRKMGDRGKDFVYNGWIIDVKTSKSSKWKGLARVRNKNNGYFMEPIADIFVFCHCPIYNLNDKNAKVYIVGWCYKTDFSERGEFQGKGENINWEMPYNSTYIIDYFLKMIVSCKKVA